MSSARKRKEVKEERSIANREAYARMNFLFQASHIALASDPENLELSRFYAATMKAISMKLLCKMEPKIKRKVCKYCHLLQLPGVTSQVRVKAKREKHVVVKCMDCGTMKRFNATKDHKLWSEQEIQDRLKSEKLNTPTQNEPQGTRTTQ